MRDGQVMMKPSDYDDGLDADGYPIQPDPEPYSAPVEEDDYVPVRLGEAATGLLERLEFAARLSTLTESPIETMLGLALVEKFHGQKVEIIAQLPWRRYRIDWTVRRAGKTDIFIECDGNEFHTEPDDVARDRTRDAEMTAAGFKVLRFTGSEIFADAGRCAGKVWLEAMA